MNPFATLLDPLGRRRRLKAYRQARAAVERISDADLADMGLRRYQLGRVARCQSLR